MNSKITIDIISDVVCPWCYIGKRRLEEAQKQLVGEFDFEIHWHPFQLNPFIPEEGVPWKPYMAQKFGSEERTKQIAQHVTNVGKEEGIQFDFENTPKAINTFHLHRLLRYAKDEGVQNELSEIFFKANFEENRDLTNKDVQSELLQKAGISKEKAEEVVHGNHFEEETMAVLKHLATQDISGVPFFIINNKYAISGAQPPETFINIIKQTSLIAETNTNESCDINGENC